MGPNLGIWGSFRGKIGEFGGKIGSNDTHYGIPFVKTRRLRYYMQILVWGSFLAKLGDLDSFKGNIGEFGEKLGQMTLTTAFLSPSRAV